MRVFLLRHAESANPNVFHGAESDIDLSPRGQRQADAVARVLARHEPDVVISSAMLRAKRTAAAIARLSGSPHHIEPRLHERRVGMLSGQPFDTGGIWPETARRWTAGEFDYAHDGAESFNQIHARILPAWDAIVRDHDGRRVVIVAHGVVCKVLLVSMFPDQTWETIGPIRNAAITELRRDQGTWTIERLTWAPPELDEV